MAIESRRLLEYCLKRSLYSCTLIAVEFLQFLGVAYDVLPAVLLIVTVIFSHGFECGIPVMYICAIVIPEYL